MVRFLTSASRGLRQFWSLWKSTVHPKVTSCTWPVPCAGAQHPVCPGTWTTSASTRTKIITSPIRAACAPCTFSESGRWTTANIRSLLSTLSAKQSALLNSLLEVSTFEENSLWGFVMKCFSHSVLFSLLFLFHRLKFRSSQNQIMIYLQVLPCHEKQ